MPYQVDMNTFWCDWQVVSGDTTAFDEYTTFKNGLLMQDGSYVYNMKELCDYQGYGGNRYKLFTYYQQFNDNIYGEYEFYKYTNDPNIYDYRTFWQHAASYLGGYCGAPPYNIAVFGQTNTQAFHSSDSGITYDNTTITIPLPLPPSTAPNNMYINQKASTQNQYEAYFGTIQDFSVSPTKSYIYKFNFTTKEWTKFYTFTPGRRIDDLLWVSPTLFFTTNVNSTNNITKSTDGGLTFVNSTLSPAFRAGKLAYQSSSNTIVVGGQGASATQRFMYSNDDGATWNLCGAHTSINQINTMTSLHHYDSIGMFVATFFNSGFQGGHVLYSYDGNNWFDGIVGNPTDKFTDSAFHQSSNILMISNDTNTTGYLTIDNFLNVQTFTQPSKNFGRIICIQDIGLEGRFIQYVLSNLTNQSSWYSDDKGNTWTMVSQDFQRAQEVIVY
jgi:hypothetical protein